MTRNEAANILLGKYAIGDFTREVRAIEATDPRWDKMQLSCGHELVGTKNVLMLRDQAQCNLCAKAWMEEHTTE